MGLDAFSAVTTENRRKEREKERDFFGGEVVLKGKGGRFKRRGKVSERKEIKYKKEKEKERRRKLAPKICIGSSFRAAILSRAHQRGNWKMICMRKGLSKSTGEGGKRRERERREREKKNGNKARRQKEKECGGSFARTLILYLSMCGVCVSGGCFHSIADWDAKSLTGATFFGASTLAP